MISEHPLNTDVLSLRARAALHLSERRLRGDPWGDPGLAHRDGPPAHQRGALLRERRRRQDETTQRKSAPLNTSPSLFVTFIWKSWGAMRIFFFVFSLCLKSFHNLCKFLICLFFNLGKHLRKDSGEKKNCMCDWVKKKHWVKKKRREKMFRGSFFPSGKCSGKKKHFFNVWNWVGD